MIKCTAVWVLVAAVGSCNINSGKEFGRYETLDQCMSVAQKMGKNPGTFICTLAKP